MAEDMKFLVSVVTPIYEVEEYLEEAIESVINQTLGFDRIQLILVNDGSPDESYKICERYKAEYPDNIVYIEKENGGVSSARNEGIKHIEGKYVIFLDGDDVWEKNAFEEIVNFFDKHYDETDACSCMMKYIGDFENRKHPLSFKFRKGSRVVSLDEDPKYINTTLGNVAFKAEKAKERRFNENMKYGEDSFLVNTVLAEKRTIGIIAEAIFYYRKNYVGGNASVGITKRKEWYLDVPRYYYLALIQYMEENYGEVPRVFQEAIFYDMKWRGYNREAMATLTEEEKEQHLALLSEVLQYIDDEVIMKSSRINTFRKNYFMNLKYGKDLFSESVLENGVYKYNDRRLLNLKTRQMVDIKIITVEEDVASITGVLRFSFMDRPYSFYVIESSNGDSRYEPVVKRNKRWDNRGIAGERLVAGETFNVKIPIRSGSTISFYLDVDGETIKIKPRISKPVGILSAYNDSYNIFGDYIIKYSKGKLYVQKWSRINEAIAEWKLCRSIKKKSGKTRLSTHVEAKKERDRNNRAPLKDQVAFISIRSEDCLLDNMEKVYSMYDGQKVYYAKKKLAYRKKELRESRRIASASKVVVTDDYLFLLKTKKKGQKYVQLWHAAGAGKMFGQDAATMLLDEDAMYHRNYDAVTVSSEEIKDVYANAFRIPVDKVYATGVARTDMFFDEEHKQEARNRVFESYPQLEGKSVILFTPTFRDLPGVGRHIYNPNIDFEKLSALLKEDQVFVVKPHPVMVTDLVDREYPNIIEIRDVNTNDLMIVSDLLISDYSSTMFEYSLLRKPMGFYCYDFDRYDRDFYMDFERELPGPLLRTQEELFDYLSQDEHPIMKNYEDFYKKYMGACDGHSTERIVELIKRLLKEK